MGETWTDLISESQLASYERRAYTDRWGRDQWIDQLISDGVLMTSAAVDAQVADIRAMLAAAITSTEQRHAARMASIDEHTRELARQSERVHALVNVRRKTLRMADLMAALGLAALLPEEKR
ncbi:hypothetical protein CFN78_06865 [Amycolatopsis antarctica]|uniref:Uncharacterized protein n=1 Tax=Amycolatopsis antarctica TaxID=1854586 RepID=A0A263D660_9PSEU|nr:hypothetical protein [Amycolatopsis antarctica]OZM74002.1 hypothetical protein CFN78_06865 [Amycolatopsis antarctica]